MSEPTLLKPDLEFVKKITKSGGENTKRCFQCATCAVVCELSPDRNPYPRKEMIWAQWGLKDRLLADPDIWLCHQCNDCSTHCPRGARPGDVMATLRRESIIHHSVPGFLGRIVNEPKFFPVLLAIPAILLGLAILLRGPLENALGITRTGDRIVYSYSAWFPHWLLMSFFFLFTILVIIIMIAGVARFWRAMKAADARNGNTAPAKSIGASIGAALKSIFKHEKFTQCTTERPRYLAHFLILYGFIAVFAVSLWVMTAKYNPLLKDSFVYPFNFWNPWRILANIGGLAILAGCALMIAERLKKEKKSKSSYFDWAFLGTVILVVITGFATEFLHYARLEPQRHHVYFVHLVVVFVLIICLPYSKFAHMIYRTVAMIYAEHSGRNLEAPAAKPAVKQEEKKEKKAEEKKEKKSE
ncbi:MAG: quinone-interacting membrane-bound oxidoreductase complex subunit QmoC [Planctomycetota bacterium]|jgi:quinone-modifying oxidoreductase subunit QmoC